MCEVNFRERAKYLLMNFAALRSAYFVGTSLCASPLLFYAVLRQNGRLVASYYSNKKSPFYIYILIL